MKINDLLMNIISMIKPDQNQALYTVEIAIDKEPKLRFRNRKSIHKTVIVTLDQSQIIAMFPNSSIPNPSKLVAFHSQDEIFEITTSISIKSNQSIKEIK